MYGGVELRCYTSAMFKLYSMHYDSYLIPMKIIQNLIFKTASRKYNKNGTRTMVLWASLRVCCTIYNYVRRYYNIKPLHSQTKWQRWAWNSNEVTTTVCIDQILSFQFHIKIIQVHKEINQLIWFLTFWNCPWYMYLQGTVNTESERGVTPTPLVTSGCNGVHVHCTVM